MSDSDYWAYSGDLARKHAKENPEPLDAFSILLAYCKDSGLDPRLAYANHLYRKAFGDVNPWSGDTLDDYRFNDEPLEDYGDWQSE